MHLDVNIHWVEYQNSKLKTATSGLLVWTLSLFDPAVFDVEPVGCGRRRVWKLGARFSSPSRNQPSTDLYLCVPGNVLSGVILVSLFVPQLLCNI